MLDVIPQAGIRPLMTRFASSQACGIQDYLGIFTSALEIEFQAECRRNYRELNDLPTETLADRGLALESALATEVDPEKGSTVLQLRNSKENHSRAVSQGIHLTPGSHVLLRNISKRNHNINGVVVAKSVSSIYVRLTDEDRFMKKRLKNPQFFEESRWNVLRTVNRSSHDFKMKGLHAFFDSSTTPPHLLNLVLDAFSFSQRILPTQANPFTLYAGDKDAGSLPTIGSTNEAMNLQQKNAIEHALTSRVALLQGPPGTGKTVCAGHLVQEWWRAKVDNRALDLLGGDSFDQSDLHNRNQLCKSSSRVLLVAPSNVAVDNLLASFLSCERASPGAEPLRIARLGCATRVSEETLPFTLESLIEEHPQFDQLASFRSDELDALDNQSRCQAQDLRGGGDTIYFERGRNYAKEAQRIHKIASKLERSINMELIRGCDVVATTCVSTGSSILNQEKFGLIVIDEASQATEPEILIALQRLEDSGQVVLVGDHCQLPPVVIAEGVSSSTNETQGAAPLAMSFFERVARLAVYEGNNNAKGMVAFDLLQQQYRMHPALSAWPNKHFYSGLLVDAVPSEDRPLILGLHWPTAAAISSWSHSPVVFLNYNTSSEGEPVELQDHFYSFSNEVEARAAVDIVNAALQSDPSLSEHDVAVITPYLAQQNLILDKLVASGLDPERVEVRTVDGFQGREKDLIVFSTVRCNPERDIGFTADWRRINVALTRARRGLAVLGNAASLRTSPDWNSWLDHVVEVGGYIEVKNGSSVPFVR